MSRKTILIIVIIVVVVIIAAIVYLATRGVPAPGGSQLVRGGLPPVETVSPTAPFPSGDTFVIGTSQGGVTVKNFYKTMDYITQDQQTVVLAESSTYQDVYLRGSSSFIIDLLLPPLTETRAAAETSFLNQLGISKTDACKLAVDERVLDKTSPYDGYLVGLSFCPGAVSF